MKTKQMIKTKRQQNKDRNKKRKKTRKLGLKGKQTNKPVENETIKTREDDPSNKQFKKLNCSPKDKNEVKEYFIKQKI